MEDDHMMRWLAVRHEGKLVGYASMLVITHLHSRKVMNGIVQDYFIAPEYRSGFAGIRLFKEIQNIMEAVNAGIMIASDRGGLSKGNILFASFVGRHLFADRVNINNAMSSVTNPYMADVINPTEQAAYGANSVMNTDASAAGQFGSNRQALGANNIANQEAATIGGLEGSQFNSSMSDVLNQILPGQQTSAGLSVGAGQTQQQQQLAQSMAPYTALSAYSQLLGAIPQSGGSTSQGQQSGARVGTPQSQPQQGSSGSTIYDMLNNKANNVDNSVGGSLINQLYSSMGGAIPQGPNLNGTAGQGLASQALQSLAGFFTGDHDRHRKSSEFYSRRR
ncbi:unnamed protein product [Sphagnum balticum]